MKQYMQWTNSSKKISYFCHHDAKTCTINNSTVQAIANKDHLFVVAVYCRRKQSKTVILYNFSFESCNIILLHNIASDVRHGVWSVSSQNVNHCSYRFNEHAGIICENIWMNCHPVKTWRTEYHQWAMLQHTYSAKQQHCVTCTNNKTNLTWWRTVIIGWGKALRDKIE